MKLRPALKYNGAKWLLAPWIIEHFPEHSTYLDLFGGSGAVLIQKPATKYEIFNDLDLEVVNFFTVLRERPKDFARAIQLTLYSRAEFVKSLEPTEDPFERARRFYCLCWMSISYNFKRSTGWRLLPRNAGGGHVPANLFAQTKHLLAIARRLKNVQFESRDFREMLKVCNHADCLVYADPPYPGFSERLYNIPFSQGDHDDLIMALGQHKGPVILSGYSDLHENLMLQGWTLMERKTRNRQRASRVECLMLNPIAAEKIKEAA